MQTAKGIGGTSPVITMATDGGPHSPSKWAEATTQQILDAPADHPLRAKVLEILRWHHAEVQGRERRLLHEQGAARLEAPFSTPETIEQLNVAAGEIAGAVHDAGFRDYYEDSKKLIHLMSTLGKDFATSMNIERLWFRERAQKDAA